MPFTFRPAPLSRRLLAGLLAKASKVRREWRYHTDKSISGAVVQFGARL